MNHRALVIATVVLALSGCATSSPPAPEIQQTCTFTFESEVDGVSVATSVGMSTPSIKGESIAFQLACAPQRLTLSKQCYPSIDIVLRPDGNHYTILKSVWEREAFIRFDNLAEHPIYIDGLPGGRMTVSENGHGTKAVPLGNWSLVLSADWKNPLEKAVSLCQEAEVMSLQIDSKGPTAEIVAVQSIPVELDHGVGSLRLLTEQASVFFTLQGATPIGELLKELGVTDLAEIDLDQVHEQLRWPIQLLQRVGSERFRAPNQLVLPAGQYSLAIDRAGRQLDALTVMVQPSKETRIQLDELIDEPPPSQE